MSKCVNMVHAYCFSISSASVRGLLVRQHKQSISLRGVLAMAAAIQTVAWAAAGAAMTATLEMAPADAARAPNI